MELIVFIGIQATGKSLFFHQRFADSHIRINMDMLNTRHRESLIFNALLEAKQPVVIDNTNPARADRQRYIVPAQAAKFEIVGYYFKSILADALARNSTRADRVVSEVGIKGCSGRLELPEFSEGFSKLYYVEQGEGGTFNVSDWAE